VETEKLGDLECRKVPWANDRLVGDIVRMGTMGTPDMVRVDVEEGERR